MHFRILTALQALLMCLLGAAHEVTAPVLRADRVLVLKKERTLELLSQGRVIRSYKVALKWRPDWSKDATGGSQDSRRRLCA